MPVSWRKVRMRECSRSNMRSKDDVHLELVMNKDGRVTSM